MSHKNSAGSRSLFCYEGQGQGEPSDTDTQASVANENAWDGGGGFVGDFEKTFDSESESLS